MKKGFTLAEVLITLGIIGVVAAITIPTLITNHQKKVTVTKLQKAISILNQAYRLSYDDNGEASAQEAKEMGAEQYFKRYWEPYIKITRYCKEYNDCGYDKHAPFHSYSGKFSQFSVNSSRAKFYTFDGFLYIILVDQGDIDNVTTATQIYIDLNGGQKPNIFGRDVFILNRVVDEKKGGSVQPECYGSSNAYVNNNCTRTAGTCCAEKIRRTGWQIDKSYPWK